MGVGVSEIEIAMHIEESSDADSNNDSDSDSDGTDEDASIGQVKKCNDTNGFVYIMEDQPGRFRVSSSREPARRHLLLLAGNIDLKLRAQYPVAKRLTAETLCHEELLKYQMVGHGGCWFTGLDFRILKCIVETAIGANPKYSR